MPINYNDELRLAYLRAAVSSVTDDQAKVASYRAFFEGEQGALLTDRQKEYLLRGDNTAPESFGNICRRVVNVPKDRLELTADGIRPADPNADAYASAVTDWWNANQLNSAQKDIYEAALKDGTTAVIVGWDGEKPTFTPNLVYDGETGLIRFHYDNDDNLLYASKRWRIWDPLRMGETGKTRLTMYMPERIERYIEDQSQPDGWLMLSGQDVANETGGLVTQNPQPWVDSTGAPYGIPVIPFENPGGSELADVLTVQKLLNHNLGMFDEAVDLHNWPILWGAGLSLPVGTDNKKYVPGYGSGKFFELATDGKMGRIEPADLAMMFQSGVLSWVQLLAIIKGWPLFSLDRSTQPPSGVALKIMEGGLVSQVHDKHAVFGGSWLRAFDMARRLSGQSLDGEIELEWQPAETQDARDQTETQAIKWEKAGIPTLTRWRECGYTEEDIDQMLADQAQEQAAQMNSLASAMMEQQRQFDQGGNA